jgi:hypothetical protein
LTRRRPPDRPDGFSYDPAMTRFRAGRVPAALRAAARAGRQALASDAPAEEGAPPDAVDYGRVEEIVRRVADRDNEAIGMHRLLLAQSAAASAQFVLDNIPLHLGRSHYELRREAVAGAPDGGLFLEFGVWSGSWLRQMAAVRDVPFYGFDSFAGLPEPWSTYQQGHFDLQGVPPDMPANVELVVGWFSDTLAPFLAAHPEHVSFVHVDCDLYTSTKTVLDLLAPRLVPGSRIVLDDFMLMPGWQREEHRAFFEFVEREGWQFEYTGYSAESPACSAAVRLLRKTAA